MASSQAGDKNKQPESLSKHNTKAKRKESRSKLLQKGIYFSAYFLFLGGILLFLWLGGTSDFLSPSSSSPSSSRKKKELSQNSSTRKKIIYSTEGSQLTLEEESYNFGKISQEKEVGHAFKFINTGNEELIIHNVDSS